MGIRQARSSFLSLAERKKRSKERAAATLCVRFEIIPSAGSLKLALRASDSQAPDSDLLRRPLSSANWRSHTQRVPDIADLSFGWNGFGIFDAVLRLRLGMWGKCPYFKTLFSFELAVSDVSCAVSSGGSLFNILTHVIQTTTLEIKQNCAEQVAVVIKLHVE